MFTVLTIMCFMIGLLLVVVYQLVVRVMYLFDCLKWIESALQTHNRAMKHDWEYAQRTQRGLLLCWACIMGIIGGVEDITMQGDSHDIKRH